MAIREVTVDPKTGARIHKDVPGYGDRASTNGHKKTATKAAKKPLKEALKASKNAQQRGPRTEKKAFKAMVMAVNDDNVYSKKSQVEMDDEAQLKSAFERWLKSGETGEFFAIRRK